MRLVRLEVEDREWSLRHQGLALLAHLNSAKFKFELLLHDQLSFDHTYAGGPVPTMAPKKSSKTTDSINAKLALTIKVRCNRTIVTGNF